jgi:type IV pilus assembly protein PilW
MKGTLNAFKKGDVVVTVNLGISCARTVIATAPADPDANGNVKLTLKNAVTFDSGSQLLNLGPETRVQRVRYFIQNEVLYSQNLLDAAAAPVPLASGVVNLKAQFGVDTTGDGFLDRWISGGEAGWTPSELMQTATLRNISAIKAVRIGLITRSEQFDKEAKAQDWTLFDCDLANKTQCEGRLTGTLGAQWRYRVFETVIPLRNVIWNNAT